jgi:hypothetical protein
MAQIESQSEFSRAMYRFRAAAQCKFQTPRERGFFFFGGHARILRYVLPEHVNRTS